MKKNFPIAIVSLLLLCLTASSQTSPVLAITNSSGKAVLSWTGGSASSLFLQTTTNLAAPAGWAEVMVGSGTGKANVPIQASSQFFRLAPITSVFQFAIFYNLNLEIAAASVLNIQGPVFSNAGLWAGSTTITFSSMVSAVGLVTNSVYDPFCIDYSGSGLPTYTMPGQPVSGAPDLSVFTWNTNSNTEMFLNLPPSNYMLGTLASFTTNGQLYLANETDLYLTNFPDGTNWNGAIPMGAPMALYYHDYAGYPNYLTWVTNDFYIVSNTTTHTLFRTNYVPIAVAGTRNYTNGFGFTNSFLFINGLTALQYTNRISSSLETNIVWYMGYSFLTNVLFYDWREGWHGGGGPAKMVYAVQLDLKAYNNWMTNTALDGGSVYNNRCLADKTHPLDSIYIYNAVSLTPTVLPSVRVMNGGSMPLQDGSFGFTLATPMPLYVWGDYNATNIFGSSLSQNSVSYTAPAALMADAITVLSDSWADSSSLTIHTGGPAASQTTINAACLSGIVPSNTKNAASDANGYSGGVENYFRLLENWSAATFWFNGSIVAMFPSAYATNCWQQTGNYYTAPTRHWSFDTNFFIPSGLPPLTPTIVN
jgi:hypothetical protein